jgi:hypothetical protein
MSGLLFLLSDSYFGSIEMAIRKIIFLYAQEDGNG